MVQIEGQVQNQNYDAYDDLVRAKSANEESINTWIDFEKQLKEDVKMEGDSKKLLFFLLNKEETDNPNKKGKEKDYDVNKANYDSGTEEEENDPQSELFLKNLKGHEKSYRLECDKKDGLPEVIRYEIDTSSDEKRNTQPTRRSARLMRLRDQLLNQTTGVENHDPQATSGKKTKRLTRRKSNVDKKVKHVRRHTPNDTVVDDPDVVRIGDRSPVNDVRKEKQTKSTKQKVRFSDQVRSVRNQRKHDARYVSVRKDKSVIKEKTINEAKKVENMKYVRNDAVKYAEYLCFHRNVKREDDPNVVRLGGHTVVNEKMLAVNDRGKGILKNSMKQKVGCSNQVCGLENQPKHEGLSTSVMKAKIPTQGKSRNKTKHVERVKCTPNDLGREYLHLDQNIICKDDPNVIRLGGRTMVHENMYGVNDRKTEKQKIGFPNQVPDVERLKRTHNDLGREYPHLDQSIKREDDRNVARLGGRTTVNEKVYGVNDRKKGKQKIDFSNQVHNVERVKHTRKDLGREYLHLDQNIKRGDDPNFVRLGDCTIVKEKMYGVNNRGKDKQKIEFSNRMHGVENQRKHDAPSTSVMKTKSPHPHVHQNVKREDNVVNAHNKEKKRKRITAMELEVGHSYRTPVVENQLKHVMHSTSVKKAKNDTEKVKNMKRLPSKFRNVEAGKCVMASNNSVENNLKKESDNEVEILDRAAFLKERISGSFVPSEKSGKTRFMNVEAAKCLMTNKNIDENNIEKESDDEVEILDVAAYLKERSFVPSKRFDKTIMEEDFQIIGSTSVQNDFREKVLDVIGKPFDKEEYNRLQEAVRSGNYLDHYPDLGRKLIKYRYKKGKRLSILRGYFFWLQNLSHEGAFRPWKDGRCLAVEPPIP